MIRKLLALLVLLTLSAAAFAGAWGEGSFENDDALDWVAECVQSEGPSAVAITLKNALKPGMIDAGDGAMAIAAAEVVAAALRRPSADLPAELRIWIARQPSAQLAALAPIARKVIDRIRSAQTSELKQLWSGDGAAKWSKKISELQTRLK